MTDRKPTCYMCCPHATCVAFSGFHSVTHIYGYAQCAPSEHVPHLRRELRNEQLVWENRGVKDGLDEKVRAEILTDTLTTIKEDLRDLCEVKSADLKDL